MRKVAINDARPRDVNYVTDVEGRVLKRWETTTAVQSNPLEVYFYFDGNRIGDIGNNGPSQTDYSTAVGARLNTRSNTQFRNGSTTGEKYASFNMAYDAINPQSAAVSGAGASYTVRSGDTLRSIATAVWGDESLWYILADANGLTAGAALPPGMVLTIPAKVVNVHNTDATFKVYDPNEALGDVQPIPRIDDLAQAAPKKNGCGGVGQALLTLVAVAVTSLIAPALTTTVAGVLNAGSTGVGVLAAKFIGGAVAGAIGNVASQGVGVITGLQDAFSWKSVAQTAIQAGVSNAVGTLNASKYDFVDGAVSGAVSSTLSQGVSTAVGLQSRFDWTSVAVSAISSGVDNSIGNLKPFRPTATYQPGLFLRGVQNTATMLSAAGAQSALTGASFGDSVRASLPSVIGSTIGNAVASKIQENIVARGNGSGRVDGFRSADDLASVDPESVVDLSSGSSRMGGLGGVFAGAIGLQIPLNAVSGDALAPLSVDDPGPLSTIPYIDPNNIVTTETSSFSFQYQDSFERGSLTIEHPTGLELYYSVKEQKTPAFITRTLSIFDRSTGGELFSGAYYEGMSAKTDLLEINVTRRDQVNTTIAALGEGVRVQGNDVAEGIGSLTRNPVGSLKAVVADTVALAPLVNPVGNWDEKHAFVESVAESARATVGELRLAAKNGRLGDVLAYQAGKHTVDIAMAAGSAVEVGALKLAGGRAVGSASKTPLLLTVHDTTSGAKIVTTAGRTTTVIGAYKSDIVHILREFDVPTTDGPLDDVVKGFDAGNPGGLNFLNVSDEVFREGKSRGGFFTTVNSKWVDAAAARRDPVIVASHRRYMQDANGKLTGFGKEVDRFINKHGYSWNDDFTALVPPKK